MNMNAQISFLEGDYKLIHIPLGLYSSFLQPILRLLIPQTQELNFNARQTAPEPDTLDGLTTEHQHTFLNISVTPIECSLVVHESWASRVFDPVISRLSRQDQRTVTVSKESYNVLSVISAGMHAGERVMELTSPLAMAGIPIFFITTYYSDFIVVPARDRPSVISTLLERGFAFSDTTEKSFIAATPGHSRHSSKEVPRPSGTPPPSTLAELQTRTFDTLKKRNVVPYTIEGLRLMQCSGRENSQLEIARGHSLSRYCGNTNGNGHNWHESGAAARARQTAWLDGVDPKLYTALVSALVSTPTFLSVTLATEDPPSLLMDRELVGLFGDTLQGAGDQGDGADTSLVPIFLDLAGLPLEATGIVSGVAGRLVKEIRGDSEVASELSYLSTTRAGAVILGVEGSKRALEVLSPQLEKK